MTRACGFLVRCVALWAVCACAHAQFLPVHSDSLDSRILAQKRALEVYLPEESARDPAQKYETIYVLDGDWNTKIVVQIVSFMRQVGFMPPVIVVSVPNFFDDKGINSRDHDLTPTVVVDQQRSGGAAPFLSFLKSELVPYVDQHYPANGTHLVHGHSYGGLFLIYALMNDPSLFDGYLVLDPAMGWDKHALDAVIDSKLAATPANGKAIYIAGRSGGAWEGMGIAGIEPIFQRRAPADLHWKISAYPDETHDSLKLKATYDALKFAYQGYTGGKIELVPEGGLLVKGKPMILHVNSDRAPLHYTTDGSEPTAASPTLGETIAISDPENTRIKLLSNRGVFDRTIAHNLASGSALAPDKGFAASDAWRYAFHPAAAWPITAASRPFRSGSTKGKVEAKLAGRDDFSGVIERNLAIPADGYYIFHVQAADQATLTLSGKPLLDADGSKGRRENSIVVPLQRGVYRTRLEFRHPTKTAGVELSVFQNHDGEERWWKNELFKVSD
jgi:predicted alpha/beta superfamily hydrolase